MKKLILATTFIAFGVGILSLTEARGQTSKRLSSTPAAFQTFYRNFRNAVIRRDKPAVVAMTQFPFEYGWDAGDEGTYTRSRFLANFNHIFGNNKKIFRETNPTFYIDGKSFGLTDEEDASHYGFVKTPTGYKFASIMVEP